MKFNQLKKLCLFVTLLSSTSVFAGLVNINKADGETLAHHLKGVGVKKAEAIIEYRKEYGAFVDIEDLVNVKGIGESTLEKNAGDLSLTEGAVAMVEDGKIKKTEKKMKEPIVISKPQASAIEEKQSDSKKSVVAQVASKNGSPIKVTREAQSPSQKEAE